MTICSVEGCEKAVKARGWCSIHYNKVRLYGDPLGGRYFRSDPVTRFWSKVDQSGGPDACWNWTDRCIRGYGHLQLGRGTKIRAHRFSWELHFGSIPEGLFVCHTCDNPSCCNPSHLFLGTVQDNTADMVEKGRQARGTKHHNAALTEDDVRRILSLPKTGSNARALSEELGVSRTSIYNIWAGKTWAHVDRH